MKKFFVYVWIAINIAVAFFFTYVSHGVYCYVMPKAFPTWSSVITSPSFGLYIGAIVVYAIIYAAVIELLS